VEVHPCASGGFKLKPLYDILSAQPLLDEGTLRRNQFKMAMSVGNNNHYRMDEIQKRHCEETANAAGLPVGTVEEICGEFGKTIPLAVDQVASLAGNVIPALLVDRLVDGVTSRQPALSSA